MSFNELLRSAVLPVVPICDPHSYTGEESVYCVFDYVVIPWTYADGKPLSANYSTQLHLYVPLNKNPLDLISQLAISLQNNGFPCPSIQDASNEVSQHYVFSFSYISYESELIFNE